MLLLSSQLFFDCNIYLQELIMFITGLFLTMCLIVLTELEFTKANSIFAEISKKALTR